MQNETDEKHHSVIYDDQKLQDAELNYSVYEKKLLIIKHALWTWQYYIENDHTMTIIMNHEDLQYLKNTSHPSKQLAQWIDEFQQYNLDIQYWPEAQAVVSDLINCQSDFIEKDSANKVFLDALWRLDNVKWKKAMILYLKDDTESEKSLLCKHVCKNNVADQFWLHYDLKLNDSYLIWK